MGSVKYVAKVEITVKGYSRATSLNNET